MSSYRHFRRNVGAGGVAVTVFLVLVLVAFAVVPPLQGDTELWILGPAGLGAAAIPWAVRRLLVARPEHSARVLGAFRWLILAGVLAATFVDLPNTPAAVAPIVAALGLYMGAFTALFSHPEVVRIE